MRTLKGTMADAKTATETKKAVRTTVFIGPPSFAQSMIMILLKEQPWIINTGLAWELESTTLIFGLIQVIARDHGP